MKRKLRMLGACLAALGALGVLGASGAGADFEAEQSPAVLTVSSNGSIQIAPNSGASSILCTKLAVDNTVIGLEYTAMLATPTISECDKFVGANVTVDSNDCRFRFTLPDDATVGTMDLECPDDPLEFTIGSLCTYALDSQNALASVSYATVGSGSTREIKATLDITNLDVTRTTNDFFCPAAGTVSAGNAGRVAGTFTLTGEDVLGTEHIGVWVD